jgi:hypothetical protein
LGHGVLPAAPDFTIQFKPLVNLDCLRESASRKKQNVTGR